MRKIILSVLGVVVIIASILIARYLVENKSKPKPVKGKVVKSVLIEKIKNTTVPIAIEANGILNAKRRVELYAEVQGIFNPAKKLFKAGQSYRSGETLISIDASEYYASVQSAKSNLYNSIAAIMPDLRLDFPNVYNKWHAYLGKFDLSKPTPDLPEASSEKENYFITGRGIVSSYYNVKNLEKRLAKYHITAPFSGVLVEALITEGTLIRSGQKLGEFIDPSVLEMEVALSKSYAGFLKVGKAVTLTNLEHTESYTGRISRVNGNIDATTQTITTFIEVRNENLKEGMYLEASLDAKEEHNAIEIDRSLLLEDNSIYIVKDSVLDKVDVTPIFFSETKVVLKGVPDGTVIIAKPVIGAYTGMLVKPLSKD